MEKIAKRMALAGLGLTWAVMLSSCQTEEINWEQVKAELQDIEWKHVQASLQAIGSAGMALVSQEADPNPEWREAGPTARVGHNSTGDWREEYIKGVREGFTEGYNKGYEDGLAKAFAMANRAAPAVFPIASAEPRSSFSQAPSWGYPDSKHLPRTESVQLTALNSDLEVEDTHSEKMTSPFSSGSSSSSRNFSRVRSNRSSSDCRT